jgi:hypothetical protein
MLKKSYLAPLFFLLLLPSIAGASPFPKTKIAVCESWKAGTDEYWHLTPVNEKTIFKSGEKVQFFAQGGPVFDSHHWVAKIYKENKIYHEFKSQTVNPPASGWNYSNYTPHLTSLPAGDYWVHYFVNLKGVEIPLSGIGFKVLPTDKAYTFHHAVAATGYKHGSGSAYWDLIPTGQNTVFTPGQTVYLNAQVRNISVSHSYKAELFRNNSKIFEHATANLNVGAGWEYGNFNPYYKNIQPGDYVYKFYINIGKGYEKLADVPFSVKSGAQAYTYHHTYIADGWKHGAGEEYWDLKPVNQKTAFKSGEKVYALSQVRNIHTDHRWKIELYKSGAKQWEYATPWNKVEAGWVYGNFNPYFDKSTPGSYEFKIHIDTGSGFKLLDQKGFTVN